MSEKFGIKDAANVTLRYKSGVNKGKIFLYADYANVSTNEWSSETVYAKAKGVNAIGWDYDKKGTLKLTFEVLDKKLLATAFGSSIVSGSTNVFAHEVLTVSSNKVSLSETPISGSVSVFKHGDDGAIGEEVSEPSVEGKDVTISGVTGVVDVFYQKQVTSAETITINANKFAENFEIIGDAEVKGTDGSYSAIQMHWLNCKIQSNVSVTMDASQPASIDITFDLLPDAGQNNDMAQYIFY